MRTLYDAIGEAGTFLVSATRLGGRHGYDEEGAWAPLGGAVTGFTKTFKRERPDALVKAVDFAPSRKTAALADRLIDETLRDPGVVEVGYKDGRRWTVGLREQQAGDLRDERAARRRQRLPGHRRRRQHRLGDRRRPGGGVGGHLPSARHRPRAGPRRIPT